MKPQTELKEVLIQQVFVQKARAFMQKGRSIAPVIKKS